MGKILCSGTREVRVALHLLHAKLLNRSLCFTHKRDIPASKELPQVNYVSLSVARADCVAAQTGTGDAVSALVHLAVVFSGQHEHLPSFEALL
jgi:hypothetical protein